MSNTISNLITEASTTTTVAPRGTRNPIKNLWVTGRALTNESLTIINDIISIVPVAVQGLKESVQLTALFTRAVGMNSVLTEEQIKGYDSLNSAQRTAFRKGLAEKGGAGFVKALTELFAEEA